VFRFRINLKNYESFQIFW